MQSSEFQLVFEGPEDESQETLRKVKGVFIADLNMSIDEVQHALSSTPFVIKKAFSEDELSVEYKALKGAGAKVLIIHPVEELEPSKPELGQNNDFDLLLDEPVIPVQKTQSIEAKKDPLTPAPQDGSLFSLDLAFDEPEAPVKTTSNATQAQDDLLFDPKILEVSVKAAKEESKPAAKSENSEINFGLELSLDAPPPSLKTEQVPPQSQTPPNDLDLGLKFDEPMVTQKETDRALSKLVSAPPPPTIKFDPSQFDTVSQSSVNQNESQISEKPSSTNQTNQDEAELLAHGNIYVRPKEEEVAEEDSQEGGEVSSKRKFTSPIPIDLLLPIVIGTIILSIGNWLLFKGEDRKAASTLKMTNAVELLSKKEGSKPAKAKAIPVLPLEKFEGNNIYPDMKVSSNVSMRGDSIETATLALTMPEPAPLTTEDLASGKLPQPWITKVEIEGMPFEKGDAQFFKGEGAARIFVNFEGERSRVIGVAKGTATYDPDNHSISGSVEISHLIDAPPADGAALVKKVPEGDFEIYLSSAFVAEKKAEDNKPKSNSNEF